jgi:hypothetical protein
MTKFLSPQSLINKLWLFDLHIECLVAYHILSYKASQFPFSSCSLTPISSLWTLVVLKLPYHILDWRLKEWGLSKGCEIHVLQLYPQLLWGLLPLCFF